MFAFLICAVLVGEQLQCVYTDTVYSKSLPCFCHVLQSKLVLRFWRDHQGGGFEFVCHMRPGFRPRKTLTSKEEGREPPERTCLYNYSRSVHASACACGWMSGWVWVCVWERESVGKDEERKCNVCKGKCIVKMYLRKFGQGGDGIRPNPQRKF